VVTIELVDRTRYSFDEGEGPTPEEVFQVIRGKIPFLQIRDEAAGEVHIIPRQSIGHVVFTDDTSGEPKSTA
jgi:hypothetical protein